MFFSCLRWLKQDEVEMFSIKSVAGIGQPSREDEKFPSNKGKLQGKKRRIDSGQIITTCSRRVVTLDGGYSRGILPKMALV